LSGERLNKAITFSKFVGLGLLAWHVWTKGFHLDFLRLLLYLGIVGFFAGAWLVVEFIYEKMSGRDPSEPMSHQELRAMETLLEICREVGKKPWMVLLIPGEDGLFFLPLLYIGVNPVSAFFAAAIFGAAHLVCKPFYACLGTAVISYFLCLFVLPYGIGAMVIGHMIVDLSVFAMTPYLKRKLEKERNKLAEWEYENQDFAGDFYEEEDSFCFFDEEEDCEDWDEISCEKESD
jgi:hypothetical protein